LLHYTHTLGERLGKSRTEILAMGADEFFDWMAFDMLKDDTFRKKVELMRSKDMSDEERSNAIKAMFASLGSR